MRLLCRIGLHAWTPWVRQPLDRYFTHEDERHCKRCGRSVSIFYPPTEQGLAR